GVLAARTDGRGVPRPDRLRALDGGRSPVRHAVYWRVREGGSVIVVCAVCFRGGDPIFRDSLNAGIGVLLGVTAVVLVCFALFFIRLARRSRAAAHVVGRQPLLDGRLDVGSAPAPLFDR